MQAFKLRLQMGTEGGQNTVYSAANNTTDNDPCSWNHSLTYVYGHFEGNIMWSQFDVSNFIGSCEC